MRAPHARGAIRPRRAPCGKCRGRQLRGSLALEAIIKAEGIEATEEEVDAEMQKMADQYGLSLEDVKKYLRSADVEEQIKREKALKLVVDSASVKVAE